jgi:alkylation response protein AidB-like acyl-CoA dehydrogenase
MNDLQLSEHEYRWAYSAIDEVLPTDVHMAMVIPALEYQTSPEQRERWLPLAKSFKILGAYVQTELGHGSNVRALETTATYDADTKEWVLHSPTLTSTKWWPGGLGKTATHAVRSLLTADQSVAAVDYALIQSALMCSVHGGTHSFTCSSYTVLIVSQQSNSYAVNNVFINHYTVTVCNVHY